MKKTPPWIHTPDDGRGLRKVFVNGNEIDRATWADTRAGVVWFIPPGHIRLKRPKRDEVYTRRLRGVVTVEEI